MKSSAMLGTALLFGASLFGAPTVFAGEDAASARVQAVSGSRARGAIFFYDNGNPKEGLEFSGVARGLNPSKTYVSLIYDPGSSPQTCLPTGDNTLTFGQMVLGVWKVYGNGVGVLQGRATGDDYASLDAIGTTSIRLDTKPGTPLPSAADPARFVLQACGKVK